MAHHMAALAARFREDGFVLVKDLLDQAEVDDLDRGLKRYIQQVVPTVPRRHVAYETEWSGPIKHLSSLELYDDYFKRLLHRPATIELLQACLGTGVEAIASEVFYKPARVGSAAPYHQDNAYLHYEPAEGLVVWIALDDATIENGCVHYAKGTHKLGDLPHYETGVNLFSKRLSKVPDLNKYPEVAAILRRGDASIHHILTVHRSGPNQTDRNRRGVVLNYRSVKARVNEARRAAHDAYVGTIYKKIGAELPQGSTG